MKEIKSIINAWKSIELSTVKASLATVVRVEGSSYRRTGARMLVLDNGSYFGGISGGCLEGDALRKAQKAMLLNKPATVTYDTTQEDEHQVGVGLGCNGVIDVLFTPLNDPATNPVTLLTRLADARQPGVLVTVTGCSTEAGALAAATIYENDQQFLTSFPIPAFASPVLADLKECLINQASQTASYSMAGDAVSVFIEVIIPTIHLIIYGGNYDIYPLVRIAKELGWQVTIVTAAIKADKQLFQIADAVVDKKEGDPATDEHTAIVLMAHDYKTDFANLARLIHSNVSYVGLLGPLKRARKMFDVLEENGHPLTNADRQRIFAPAGLDIGATTPEEIALSIVAEIKSHFAGKKGSSLRLKEGTIHDH